MEQGIDILDEENFTKEQKKWLIWYANTLIKFTTKGIVIGILLSILVALLLCLLLMIYYVIVNI